MVERTHNILKGSEKASGTADGGTIDSEQLKEAPEKELWQLYSQHAKEVEELAQKRNYIKATERFGELFFEPLHRFFDEVMVNVEDQALRRNRLALMRAIRTLYTERIADLSKLTSVQQEEKR